MRSLNHCWLNSLKLWLLVTVVAVSGCGGVNIWIFPDEEGGDQSTAVVEDGGQEEREKPAPRPIETSKSGSESGSKSTANTSESATTEIPEFADGKLRVLLWRESDDDRVPRWMLLLLTGERWDSWIKVNKAEYRAWDQHHEIGRRESAGWKKAAQTYRPKQVPWLVIFKGGKPVVNGPPQFTSKTPDQQLEDLIQFCESAGK